jgi:asparagine synthase (glutamine-hydrolysing)
LILDRRSGNVILFNDRFGMHRLYYYEDGNTFFFAAEAKSILAVCPETRELDPQGVGEFVSCGAVLENRTLFRKIKILPPASAWSFQNGTVQRKTSYFHPREWEEQERLDPESYYQELRAVFRRNLPRYYDGDLRIGMSLTGGLDSRIILANHEREPGSLPCYTFGSMFRENSDVRIAKRVAAAIRQTHQVIEVGEEFLSRFADYAQRTVLLSDGCLEVGRTPDLYVNERAAEIAPVRIAGTYGGEVLRGVRAFKAEDPAPGIFEQEIVDEVQRAKKTCSQHLIGHPVSFAVFKLSPWALYPVLGIEETQLNVRTPFLDNEFVKTVFRAPASALESNEVSLRLIGDGNRDLLGIPTDRGLLGGRGRIAEAIANAVQTFTFKCEYAYDVGMPQSLAGFDNAFRFLHLEKAFLGRHKVFHFRIWYRQQIAEYVKAILLDERALSRPHIRRKKVEAIVLGHTEGWANHTTEISRLLTLELIHRLLLVTQERGGVSRLVQHQCGTA